MSDPITFKGPKGYTFALYPEPHFAGGVVVSPPGAPLDHGDWIPVSEMRAFVAALDAFEARVFDSQGRTTIIRDGGK